MLKLSNISLSFPTYYKKTFSIVEWACDKLFEHKSELSNSYKVLDNISCTINKGETIAIIGKNGCGKSTLLKVIAGIYAPDSGSILGNNNVTSLLGLGTGFDNHLSGLENIYLNGLLIGLRKEEIDKKLEEIINFADIGSHINKPMKYYSSGMISRLSFAISLAIDAEILLIDEIFSVGDLEFTNKSSKAMKDKFHSTSTKIIVSHNLSLVQELCQRVIVINNKTIGYDGEINDGIEYYQNLIR